MAMTKVLLKIYLTVILAGCICEALECCSEYTDMYGQFHKAQICQDYCCLEVSVETITEGTLRSCCSNEIMRVPAAERTDECIKSWIEQNIWVPIVSGGVLLLIIIAIVICCCCCCRR